MTDRASVTGLGLRPSCVALSALLLTAFAPRDAAMAGDAGRLTGQLRAPAGSRITLRNNGVDEIVVTVPTARGAYGDLEFRFPRSQPAGSAYAVTVAGAPPGQTCLVRDGGTGAMPVAPGVLRVDCEWTYDHVSRSSDDSVRALNVEAWSPQLGGSDAQVGASAPRGEGRYVAFVSSRRGLSPNGQRQVFWRDRQTGETRLVSADPSGAPGDAASEAPAISADGRVVAFQSAATNLVRSDENGVTDIFLWSSDQPDAGVRRISVGADGREADGASRSVTVNGEGSVVAFASLATNIGGKARSGVMNVYRHDVAAGTSTLVSVDLRSGEGVGGDLPSISEDGDRIAYWSTASTITNGDVNGMWDIFVYQHNLGRQRRVSLRADGGERDPGGDSASRLVAASMSGDGRRVAFASSSPDLVPDDTNDAQDVFVVDLEGPLNLRRVSVATDGRQGDGASPYGLDERVAIDHDGSRVAFTTSAANLGASERGPHVVMRDLSSGKTLAVTDGVRSVGAPALSRDGGYVAFGAGKALDPRFGDPGLFVFFSSAASGWSPPVTGPATSGGFAASQASRPDRDVTTPTLVYSGVAMPSSLTTPTLVYSGAAMPSSLTTPTLVYSGAAMPSSVTTPPLVFQGVVWPPGGITVPTMVYDGAKTP